MKKYEALKPIASNLKKRGDSLSVANKGLHTTIVYQKKALVNADSIIVIRNVLYLDADTKAKAWEKKAKSRWWLSVGLGALSLFLGTVALK